ncbi:dienelactone hydrolase family protein [Janibacter cremeus]|uniref:Dienelactone hydrolase n=1 Tax=Janibacter cremeus TaxID=1285192 RepID=A0A852VQI0_9MICO|nr:dienelactone hydrolase family protein [Janibacter cremeus]NYF97710.1 dienelactone hydrolase [Janibacter cremeus]
MAHVLLFPSILGVRQGITDLANTLTDAGHDVTTVDPYDGQTFDDYPSGMARTKEIGEETLQVRGLEVAKGVGAPFVAVGFSVGAAIAQWVAAQCPDTARAVVMVGGGIPMHHLGATWPAGVAGEVHVTAGDPFHEEDRQFDAMIDEQLQEDVERAGGEFAYVEYQGEGHLFSDPSLGEYQPEEARIFTRRVVELVDSLG